MGLVDAPFHFSMFLYRVSGSRVADAKVAVITARQFEFAGGVIDRVIAP